VYKIEKNHVQDAADAPAVLSTPGNPTNTSTQHPTLPFTADFTLSYNLTLKRNLDVRIQIMFQESNIPV